MHSLVFNDAAPTRIELVTFGLEVQRSIQLSQGALKNGVKGGEAPLD